MFVDDYNIAERSGFVRRLNPAKKHAGPVMVADKPWETYTANPQVIYDPREKRFRMWYYASTPKLGLQGGYAVSYDGLKWAKPHLGLVDYDGSINNNLIDSPGRVGNGVLYTPETEQIEGPDRVYKMLSWIPLKGAQRFVPLFSADGLRWKPAKDLSEPQGIMGDWVGDTGTVTRTCDCYPLESPDLQANFAAFPRFHLSVGRFCRRAVGFSYSKVLPETDKTFVDWFPPFPVLSPDFIDDRMANERLDAARDVIHYDHPEDRHCEFYGMIVHRYEELFLGFIWVFDVSMNMSRIGLTNQHGTMHIQLAASRDLIHWERLGGRQPFIDRSASNDWDSAMIHFNSYPITVGDEVRVYYTGNSLPHPSIDEEIRRKWLAEVERGERVRTPAIGLATVPRDRFVSLDAGEDEAYLITRPFELPEGRLHLNVDAEGGEVSAELLDPSGRRIDGLAESEPITGDSLSAPCSWKASDLAPLRGQKISLLLRARRARLYSYWFGQPE